MQPSWGTSFGFSTLHRDAALRDNGGGWRITRGFEPSKVARARQNLLLLLDGAKGLYPATLSFVEPGCGRTPPRCW